MNTPWTSKLLAMAVLAGSVALAPAAAAHGQGQGWSMGQGPCQGQQGMGPGMMGQGMGPGMMGQGMGPGMMGCQGMGPGMMGQGTGQGGPYRDKDLDVDEVKAILQHRLEHQGNARLRVGKVEEKGDAIVAEVETVDGSLVERYSVDRHTGRMQRSN